MKTTTRILVAAMWILAACGGSVTPTETQLSKVSEAAKSGQSECLVDSDCGAGETCKHFCGNGWCGEVCIPGSDPAPVASDCQTDADCAASQSCQTFCGNGWCDATCVDKAPTPAPTPGCQSDADCGAGSVCTTYCGNGWCDAVCVAAQCQADPDCAAGSSCQSGKCTPSNQTDCTSDASCPAGLVCQSLCGNGWCHASCVAANPDPVDACVKSCGIGACISGASCWSDGNDYLCNTCVAACHGATRITCPDPVDACVKSCGIGCAAPGFLCFSDGNQYCSSCVAACHGATQVDCTVPATVTVDDGANGTTVELKAGQALTVSLASLGDAGYSNWVVTSEPDATIVNPAGSTHLAGTTMPGDFGTDVFDFQALKAGQTSLTATATRVFSGETQTFTLTIDVQ